MLKAIDKPTTDFGNPMKAFSEAFKHEQFISKSINELMDLAIKEKDHATKSFLQWFVDEQVEEEKNAADIVQQLELIDNKGTAVLMLDHQLGKRKGD